VNSCYILFSCIVVISGQLIKVLDDFEKLLLAALDEFLAALHTDLRKAAVSSDTLLRVGCQQRSTVTAKVCCQFCTSSLLSPASNWMGIWK